MHDGDYSDVCVVEMDRSQSVMADFTLMPAPSYPVSASKTGTRTGRVTSAPAGIDCGSSCTDYFDTGSSVVLTATPDPGSIFVGWWGACTNVSGTCTVEASPNQNRDATAIFDLDPGTSATTCSRSGTTLNVSTGVGGSASIKRSLSNGVGSPLATAVSFSGGTGNDKLTGGNGADVLNGGDNNDTIKGVPAATSWTGVWDWTPCFTRDRPPG